LSDNKPASQCVHELAFKKTLESESRSRRSCERGRDGERVFFFSSFLFFSQKKGRIAEKRRLKRRVPQYNGAGDEAKAGKGRR
jgi:hypothetical protein